MKILLLCEGNAETRDSWSGVSMSVVEHLRAIGHTVVTGDVDLYGPRRWLLALRTFSPSRKRWWVRYHLHRAAFRARSRVAARRIRELGDGVDIVLQIGATFRVETGGIPLVLYCDSNIAMSRAAIASGYSEAVSLTGPELDDVQRREARVYHDARRIFTMSDMLRRSFMEDFRIPADRLVTVHCGPNVQVPEAPRRAEGELATAPTVLFVGRDFARKGGDLLMRAFPDVRRQIPDARLLVVGQDHPPVDPPEWADFMGFQSRDTADGAAAMDEAYRRATVFCLPTRFEPFGTSFVEAMLYGLACVGPNAWAVPEIIVDGETGVLVPPDDPPALAEALVHVLVDPRRARDMGLAGRRRAMEAFSWSAMADRMTRHMASLVGPDDAASLSQEPRSVTPGRSVPL